MSFGQAVASFFKNYVNFTGRARRREFWFVFLFTALVSLGIGVLEGICNSAGSYVGVRIFSILDGIWAVAIIIPTLSLQIRRLHDIGRHWYSIFFYLIPFAEIVFYFIFNCTDSQGDNEFGPSPKYPGAAQYGQPQYGQQYAQPQYGQQQYGQPQYNQPQQAQHYYGQQQAQPQQAQPQYYQPQAAQPQQAQPQYYQPQAAQPQYYQPQSAQPQYYQPQAAQPTQPAADANNKPESWN